jgi:hypothetical protein
MKASPVMFFNYLGMIGVPVLLVALAVASLLGLGRTVQFGLLVPIAAGCLLYGAIGMREVFIHGGKKRAQTGR